MRRKLSVAAVFVLCLFAGGLAVRAQEADHRFELFGEFGGAFLSNKAGTFSHPVLDTQTGNFVFRGVRKTADASNTGRLFVGFRYYFSRADAFEASYSWSPGHLVERQQLALEDSRFQIVTLDPMLETDIHQVAFNYVRYLKAAGRVRPFVTGGFGFVHIPNNVSDFSQPTKFAANFGGGADFALGERLAVRIEYRDYIMGQPLIFDPDFSPRGTAHYHGPSAGLVFRF